MDEIARQWPEPPDGEIPEDNPTLEQWIWIASVSAEVARLVLERIEAMRKAKR